MNPGRSLVPATAFKNFKNGKADIVREFVDAFRKQGIKIGFFYCAPGTYDNRLGNPIPEGRPPCKECLPKPLELTSSNPP